MRPKTRFNYKLNNLTPEGVLHFAANPEIGNTIAGVLWHAVGFLEENPILIVFTISFIDFMDQLEFYPCMYISYSLRDVEYDKLVAHLTEQAGYTEANAKVDLPPIVEETTHGDIVIADIRNAAGYNQRSVSRLIQSVAIYCQEKGVNTNLVAFEFDNPIDDDSLDRPVVRLVYAKK